MTPVGGGNEKPVRKGFGVPIAFEDLVEKVPADAWPQEGMVWNNALLKRFYAWVESMAVGEFLRAQTMCVQKPQLRRAGSRRRVGVKSEDPYVPIYETLKSDCIEMEFPFYAGVRLNRDTHEELVDTCIVKKGRRYPIRFITKFEVSQGNALGKLKVSSGENAPDGDKIWVEGKITDIRLFRHRALIFWINASKFGK